MTALFPGQNSRAMLDPGAQRAEHVPVRWRPLVFALIALLLSLNFLLGTLSLLAAVLLQDVHAAYMSLIVSQGKQPAFLLTSAFLVTFGVVRLITYSIKYKWLPFLHDIHGRGGIHIHHMVPGMLLVLTAGYFGLVLPGDRWREFWAVLFGSGTALVLDEFALWLRLADVYWEPEGRESIDAVVLAAGLGILYLLGLDFWPHLIQALLAQVEHLLAR